MINNIQLIMNIACYACYQTDLLMHQLSYCGELIVFMLDQFSTTMMHACSGTLLLYSSHTWDQQMWGIMLYRVFSVEDELLNQSVLAFWL